MMIIGDDDYDDSQWSSERCLIPARWLAGHSGYIPSPQDPPCTMLLCGRLERVIIICRGSAAGDRAGGWVWQDFITPQGVHRGYHRQTGATIGWTFTFPGVSHSKHPGHILPFNSL